MTHWSFHPIMNSYGIVAALAIAMLLTLSVRPFRRLGSGQRRTLLLLRFLVILILIAAMLRPTHISTQSQPQTAILVVLFDTSRSMQLPNASGNKSRWDAEKETLQAIEQILATLGRNIEVKVLPYDARLGSSVWLDGALHLPQVADGPITDIGSSLHEAVHAESGKRLAGVILMGDGTQTAYDPPFEIHEAARELGNLGYPLYSVAFGPSGDASQSRDVAVENMPEHYTVFVKNELTVRGLVRVRGYVNKEIPVELIVVNAAGQKQTVGPITIQADQDNESLDVTLTFTPQDPGQYKLILQAPQQPGELVTKNNQLTAFLTVLEGGLKVLYLEGTLRQEQKFIRWALDRSPDIDLDFQWFPRRLRASWPVDLGNLFEKGSYDAYILGDCDSSALGTNQFKKMAAEVEQGKGLIALGGYHAFGPGGYRNTPLGDVLPVEMDRFARQDFDHPDETRWHIPGPLPMIPTRPHPITWLAAPEANQQVWRELKPLKGANRWAGVKQAPGVQVLAESPEGAPLLVAGQYAEGRVLAFAGDSTWQWWRQGRQDLHMRFWRQVILWLARRDDLARHDVWIELERRRFPSGSRVVFTAGIRTSSEDVIRDASVDATFTDATGQSHPVRLSRQGDHFSGNIASVTNPGSARIDVVAQSAGGQPLGQATAMFEVMDQDIELSNPAADHDQMARLAHLTRDAGGRAVAPEQLADLLEQIQKHPPKMVEEVLTRWQLADTWWDAWLVLLCLTLLLGIEWFLRKRWALV